MRRFGSKQRLIVEAFRAQLRALDLKLTERMANDPVAWGSFTRVHIDMALGRGRLGAGGAWAAFWRQAATLEALRRIWIAWVQARERGHAETDGRSYCTMARLPADGAL